jgi:integrase
VYLKDNPTQNASRIKVDDAKPPRFLTVDECSRLLETSPPHLYQIYFTFLHTGMRKSELENLQWGDVDFQRKKIRIQYKEDWQPKSGERDIPMTDALSELLVDMKSKAKKSSAKDYVFIVKQSGHSRNWIREQLIQVARKADIEDLTKLHTLRHTFASHLVMQGVDLPTVKKPMGHSDIETTMIYAHLAPDHLARAVTKLPFKLR